MGGKLNSKSEKLYDLESYSLSKEVLVGQPVYLNVYHFTKFNYITQIFGIGLYHTTLEVFEVEFYFGNTLLNESGINSKLTSFKCECCTLVLKGSLNLKHIY